MLKSDLLRGLLFILIAYSSLYSSSSITLSQEVVGEMDCNVGPILEEMANI